MRFYYPLFAGLMAMIGALLIATQVMSFRQAAMSKQWKPVEAEIVSMKRAVKLGAKYDAAGDGLRNLLMPKFFALPRISYEYSVGGTTYASVNYSYAIDPIGKKQDQVDEEYPLGSVATAYYDPFSPTDAVIKPGLSEHFLLTLCAGVGLLGLGVAWLMMRNSENMI